MQRLNQLVGQLTTPVTRTFDVNPTSASVPDFFDACEGMENTITNMNYGKVKLYFGPGALNKLDEIIKKFSVVRLGVVTDKVGYKACGAWPVVQKICAANNVPIVHFDGIKSNPYFSDIEDAVKLFRPHHVSHVLSIGGGSAVDSGKVVALLLNNPGMDLTKLMKQEYNDIELEALPIIAINTTHGTGTEVNSAAVVTIKIGDECFKPAIGFRCIYPTTAIVDPQLATSLPMSQTIYTSVDALNHVMETVSTKKRNPFAIALGRKVFQIVGKYLPLAIKDPKNVKIRYWLHTGATLAGFAFDSCGLHLTHAMEHPMAAFQHRLPHGLGLAVIQPSVLKAVYPACAKELAYVMNPIFTEKLKGIPSEAHKAGQLLEEYLVKVGIPEKMPQVGYPTEADCKKLADNLHKDKFCYDMAYDNCPVPVTYELIYNIFKESLKPLRDQ